MGADDEHKEEDPSPLAFRIGVEAGAAILSALSVGECPIRVLFFLPF
jgi:hypothetical protein